jgi:hypothetical protein
MLYRHDVMRLSARLETALAPETLTHLKATGAAWTEDQALREALAA